MTETAQTPDASVVAAHEERIAFVHRQIKVMVREAPVGCLTDMVFFFGKWVDPLVDHVRLGIEPPSTWSLADAPRYQEMVAHIWNDLEHRGFIVPPMTWFVDDPIGAFLDWHDYLVKLFPWLTGAPQVELDAIIGSISEKH